MDTLFAGAMASLACLPTEEVYSKLEYIEMHQVVSGIASGTSGGVMEVWATDDAKEWFMFLTLDDGSSCIGFTGEDLKGELPVASK